MRRSHGNNRVWWITFLKKVIQIDKRKWNDTLACDIVERKSLEWKISKRLTALVRHRDLVDREIDGAVHWSSLCSKLRRDFESDGAWTFSDSQWLDCRHRGSSRPRFQCCTNSNNNLLHVRAIQGHSGAVLIALELMNHVAIPLRWKEFQFHVGNSFTVNSILQAALIAGGKGTQEGRQTVFFTLLYPFGGETEREYDDWTVPTKAHYKNKWKVSQDAVNWVNLEKAHEKRITIPADTISCHYLSWFSASWLHRKSGEPSKRKFCIKGFLRHDRLRKLCWRTLGRWSKANYHAARNRVRREIFFSKKLFSWI